MIMQKLGLLGLVSILLSACTTVPPKDPAFAPVAPASLQPPVSNNGSIYQAGYDMRLFEDNKAMRVGDVLTIKLKELTQAKKADDLNAKKDVDVLLSAPTVAGFAMSSLTGNDPKTELAGKRDFNGEGEANQSNSLVGDISVTVVEVLPNGNLRVRGEKRVTLNQGDEYIRLAGIVRPVDIDTSNTVSSDKVADATIMYTGEGAMADASKMGWLARIIYSPWFPF
ncbi:flagellar basal body L-ring protein FlgH [Candidatus Methylomicrobium oryzae]|jgi:flagellar L-ring protein precursor FlgH|uniref:flagellar basal body L-ring protein FlgH n=1 Tax=Candidatus Methylomicrobium oryzae TaxID=2802053 RepID=UPI0019247C08|nr:flagellar basal body L-ring protein FlgH [Methylomicrobium sp. RS1]MBL1265156.1 flagellar basal body L-ring protein FlgH [Methylomicrobium sp. RS1]